MKDEKNIQYHFKKGEMDYSSYLQLEGILSQQKPLSPEHDEMLFIILHQSSELWLKLSLFELDACIKQLQQDNLDLCFKMLSRLTTIQKQLIQSWDILSTMTPSDYSKFRNYLGSSSGFQSYQYRLLEFKLGNKNPQLADVYQHRKEIHQELTQCLNQPSIYDESLILLSKKGFAIPQEKVKRDWKQAYKPCVEVEMAWEKIYKASKGYWDLYELAEKLLDLDDRFQQWRFHHMLTVKRIIGFKQGTGGSSGVHYLQKRVGESFFPELWSVRSRL